MTYLMTLTGSDLDPSQFYPVNTDLNPSHSIDPDPYKNYMI